MNKFYISGGIMLLIAAILIIGVIFFSFLKYVKKRYYPTWKFPDYISVGYVDYLYHRYIKKDLQK